MKYLGIDWAHRAHVAVLLASKGGRLALRRCAHTPGEVRAFLSWLESQGGPQGVRVGIESGADLLVEQILARGYWVHVFNPKQAERCRDRLAATSAKDDPRDAHAIAEALRTDTAGLYRPLCREQPAVEELRLLDRTRLRRVECRVRLSNQLVDVLHRYFPALLALERSADDRFLLGLLRAFPTPAEGAKASRRRLEALLRIHRVRAIEVDTLVTTLRARGFQVAEHVVRASKEEALQLAEEIELLNDQIRALDRRIDEVFEAHPDREILESLPGLGKTLGARVGARVGTRRDPKTGRALVTIRGGTAPVTRQSGERNKGGRRLPSARSVRMRRACDRILQTALFAMARASLRTSQWANACYRSQIDRGVGHAPAIRTLSNKWAKILDALLEQRIPYDEATHVRHLLANQVPWAKNLTIAA